MPNEHDERDGTRRLYLDLLKRSLLGGTYFDNELRILYLRRCLRGQDSFEPSVLVAIRQARPETAERLAATLEEGFPVGSDLADMPFVSTMLGRKRLDHLERCIRSLILERIPGDLIECGVWRGGSVTFMRGMLAAYDEPDRRVWVADSFAGLPRPSAPADVALGMDLSREAYPALAVARDAVRATFEAHGLLDERVRFLEGWFSDTLPGAPIERLALLRVDGDLYSSTMDALTALYDRVVPGGFVVVDDYFLPNCQKAVDEFLVARRITAPIERIDWTGIAWRKE